MPGKVKADGRMLRYDALSVNGVPLTMSRGLCPARGPWKDPACDGLEGLFAGGMKGPSKLEELGVSPRLVPPSGRTSAKG